MQGPLFSDIILKIILLQFQLVRGRFTHSAIEAFHQNFLAHYNGLGIFDQTQKKLFKGFCFLLWLQIHVCFLLSNFFIFIFILTCYILSSIFFVLMSLGRKYQTYYFCTVYNSIITSNADFWASPSELGIQFRRINFTRC